MKADPSWEKVGQLNKKGRMMKKSDVLERFLWVLMVVMAIYIVGCQQSTYWTCDMEVEINGVLHRGSAEGDTQDIAQKRAYEIACNKFVGFSSLEKLACSEGRLRATQIRYGGRCQTKKRTQTIF